MTFGVPSRLGGRSLTPIAQDACELTLTLDDGSEHTERVAHATGTLDNPMSDTQIEEKFLALTQSTLGTSRAERLLETLSRLEIVEDMNDIVELCRASKNQEGT